ncbi:hypothetical protein [Gimesia aquarii]|uniref:Uncharacterized protein n=1 Tax=Gimesia aquarii TaxID=2527964 RepID=A0A517W1X0_9PLAN|nr:hypothetical protein [Gimesia aquarii]QDT99240.1 hypothetical protein V144x_47510 [Gimesia aquarii]
MSEQLPNLPELYLVDGPLQLPDLAYSFADDWKTEIYTAKEIGDAILSVPGVKLIHDASPNWDSWVARWEKGGHFIEFDITECEFDPENELRPGLSEHWGGSKFKNHCTVDEILFVWRLIQKKCPGVWLHDTDCRMYNLTIFNELFGQQGRDSDGENVTSTGDV